MSSISKSMDVAELNIKPPLTGKTRISDDMQQTLALLTALGADKRRPLRCSESGILNTCDPRIKDIVHLAGSGANDEITGADTPCSSCMVLGHPDNTGTVWVRPNTVASVNNAWPLEKNESVGFVLDNLSQLNALIVVDGEKIIVAYTH